MRCVSGATEGRPEKPKKVFRYYTHKYDLEEYEERRAMLDRTIPTPNGELLRYMAGEFYEILKSEFGPKPADQTWDLYLSHNFAENKTWFHERCLGLGELAFFIAIMTGRPDDVPRPQIETVDELVHSLGEECENLWEVVRP